VVQALTPDPIHIAVRISTRLFSSPYDSTSSPMLVKNAIISGV
jgi:hypothetical protein